MFLTKYCVSHYISYLNSKQYITNRLLSAVWEEDRSVLLSLFTFAFFCHPYSEVLCYVTARYKGFIKIK